MRTIYPAILAAGLLAGCVGPDGNAAVDLMRGAGSAQVGPDGARSFTFAIPQNAYRGVIDDPAALERQHMLMLSQWAAREDACPNGYKVTKSEILEGVHVYSGPCR
jgi:hypothetical protein